MKKIAAKMAIIAFLLTTALFISGCAQRFERGETPLFSDEFNDLLYDIIITNNIELSDLYLSTSYDAPLFPVIQVVHRDEALGDEINRNIIKATQWMNEDIHYRHLVDIRILTQSDRYLSFVYAIEIVARRADTVYYSIIICIQTGQRVMMNDLFDVNMDFVNKVLAVGTFHNCDDMLDSSIEPIQLLSMFESTFYTASEIVAEWQSRMGVLLFRPLFVLKDDYIVIVATRAGGLDLFEIARIEIRISCIKDYMMTGGL